MSDREVSATVVIACILWAVSVGLVSVGLVGLTSNDNVGHLGIISAAGAGTVNIRGFFCRLAGREKNAFQLGVEYANEVRSIR